MKNIKHIKNVKEQFLHAVSILSMEDETIMKFAARVPEKSLPRYPGGVAIEFVAVFEKLLGPCKFRKLRGATPNRPAAKDHRSALPTCAHRTRAKRPSIRTMAADTTDEIAIAA